MDISIEYLLTSIATLKDISLRPQTLGPRPLIFWFSNFWSRPILNFEKKPLYVRTLEPHALDLRSLFWTSRVPGAGTCVSRRGSPHSLGPARAGRRLLSPHHQTPHDFERAGGGILPVAAVPTILKTRQWTLAPLAPGHRDCEPPAATPPVLVVRAQLRHQLFDSFTVDLSFAPIVMDGLHHVDPFGCECVLLSPIKKTHSPWLRMLEGALLGEEPLRLAVLPPSLSD